MSSPRIAIDAMGGDHAPEEIVAGAILAANEYPNATLTLYGDEPRVRVLLRGKGAERIAVVHSPEAVPMDQHASHALRAADRTSLGMAVTAVKAGDADAVVSAGNTGAFLAIALVKLRQIEGVARPAIATVWPGLRGDFVLLDCGANVDCRPAWLEQFGIMGSAYATAVLGIERPRVAILSIGEERTKGNAQVLEAAELLDRAPVHFIGNIEGRDIFNNAADVVVADGFVGNVVLKTGEGMVSAFGTVIKDTLLGGSLITKLGTLLLAPALRGLRRKFDYETYGGGPFLGLRGNCIVTHGRVSRRGVKGAIATAIAEVEHDVVGCIGEMVTPHLTRETSSAESA
ncbi:MAG TPA: phosphate acyltransferase PlsX [Candidatus Baltobacteraceae bacterium]|nr:phosphate acyltransferase PlsX [Candidatus Baltobacteraceae bacterium]